MPPYRLFHSLPLSVVSFIHLVTSAPTNRIFVSHEDSKYNPVFDASRYPSISEWFSAQGRILEIANNATKECLSHFTVEEDNSVCYGDDKWEWNAVAIICVTTILAGLIVVLWLCCDWVQTSLLWYLDDAREDGQSSLKEETSRVEQDSNVSQVKAKEPGRRVDSVHSQDGGDNIQPEVRDVEPRVNTVHSETTDDDLLALPVLPCDGFGSDTPGFPESDSTLRNLGWLL